MSGRSHAVEERPLDPGACLPAGATLGDAWEAIRRTATPILAVDRGDGSYGAISALTVRIAIQSLHAASSPLAALAEPRLVVPRFDAAEFRLFADRTLAAVLLQPEGGTPRIVQRVVPLIRDAVVMAGGFGTRLRPLTDDLPKPLLAIGGEPLLCRLLHQLRAAGVERVAISVHYLADKVREVVEDGAAFDLEVRYLEEDRPLGTGAGLSLLGSVDGPFFLVNGDILTDLDLVAFGTHHQLHGLAATVATYLYTAPLPYGVVHHDAARGTIDVIEEKPVYRYPINAGIYAFSRDVLDRVEPGAPLAMVDFLNAQSGQVPVGRFPLVEYWNDVGSHEDFERAQLDIERLRSGSR
ncbi:MAG: sugar phosphate nucleotidyltransferase [Planctomycetota bacterium]